MCKYTYHTAIGSQRYNVRKITMVLPDQIHLMKMPLSISDHTSAEVNGLR